jgi:hypothetical protein
MSTKPDRVETIVANSARLYGQSGQLAQMLAHVAKRGIRELDTLLEIEKLDVRTRCTQISVQKL